MGEVCGSEVGAGVASQMPARLYPATKRKPKTNTDELLAAANASPGPDDRTCES